MPLLASISETVFKVEATSDSSDYQINSRTMFKCNQTVYHRKKLGFFWELKPKSQSWNTNKAYDVNMTDRVGKMYKIQRGDRGTGCLNHHVLQLLPPYPV